jgi:LPS-assembly lipoprotein
MRVLALLALAFLSACGFSPMYARDSAGNGPIGAVQIGTIPGKAGHALRTELSRLLDIGATGPTQRLEIALNEEVIGLGLRLDESTSRAELRLQATYIFYPAGGGPEMRGSVFTVVNYEVPVAAFAAIAAQDDARERAAETLAQRMRAELALRVAAARGA